MSQYRDREGAAQTTRPPSRVRTEHVGSRASLWAAGSLGLPT